MARRDGEHDPLVMDRPALAQFPLMGDLVTRLRSYAAALSGPQFAPLVDTLREAADALESRDAPLCAMRVTTASVLVFDDDSVPSFGRSCPQCEE